MKRILLTILLLFALAGNGWGATYYASPTGSGTTCSAASPCTLAYTLQTKVAANDTCIVAVGTYTLSAGITSGHSGVVIQGATGNPADVIIDCNNGGNYLNITAGNQTIKYLTLKNSTYTNGALYINGIGANTVTVEHNIFENNVLHWKAYNSAATVQYNSHRGVVSPGTYSAYVQKSATDYTNIIQYNEFLPSTTNLSAVIMFRGNDTTATTGSVLNNVIAGSTGYGVQVYNSVVDTVVTSKNNIIFGYNSDDPSISYALGGSASTSDCDYDLILTPVYNGTTTGFSAAPETHGVRDNPKIKSYPRWAWVALSIDDTGAWDEAGNAANVVISELITKLATYGWKATWFVSAATANTTGAKTAMKSWIEAGHDVGLHGYSHSNLTSTAVFSLTKAAQTITVTPTRTDANDPTTWSAVFQVSGQADYNATATTTLADLKTAMEARGVTVSAYPAEIESTLLATCIDAVAGQSINTAYALKLNAAAYRTVEISYAKTVLEGIIQGIAGCASCGTYTLYSWSSPYTDLAAADMDALKTSGLSIARGETNSDIADINQVSANVTNKLAIYSLMSMQHSNSATAWGALENPSNLVTAERVAGHLSWLATIGGVSGLFWHKDSWTSAELDTLFGLMQGFPNVTIGSFREIGTYIRANGTLTEGDSSGKQERWHMTYTDVHDFHLRSGSPAINAGVNICTGTDTPLTGCTGEGTGTYTDYAGKPIKGLPDIGAYEFQGGGGRLCWKIGGKWHWL